MAAMEAGDEPPDDQENVTSWTNPWIAEYKRRQAVLMEMRPFEVVAMLRDLNLTSYAFSKNAEELQAHIWRYPEIGQSQPFNPDVGDPFGIELARLLGNFLASVKSLVSGQRAVLRDVWPKIGGQLSEFEQGEYTAKRLEVFEADQAKLAGGASELLATQVPPLSESSVAGLTDHAYGGVSVSSSCRPAAEVGCLNAQVRTYLEQQGDSIDIAPIISRYTAAVREFYRWFWLKVEEKMKPERVEYDAHVAELMVYGEEVFLTPDWIRQPGGEPPPGWNGARWRRRSLAEIRQRRSKLGHKSFRGISVDSQGVAEVGEHPWTWIDLRVP
jgi:hypothetical protein